MELPLTAWRQVVRSDSLLRPKKPFRFEVQSFVIIKLLSVAPFISLAPPKVPVGSQSRMEPLPTIMLVSMEELLHLVSIHVGGQNRLPIPRPTRGPRQRTSISSISQSRATLPIDLEERLGFQHSLQQVGSITLRLTTTLLELLVLLHSSLMLVPLLSFNKLIRPLPITRPLTEANGRHSFNLLKVKERTTCMSFQVSDLYCNSGFLISSDNE